MKTISVTPSVLEHTGREIGEKADGYKRLYERLFTEVETMEQVWQGKDNVAFTQQITGFRNDFQQMEGIMRDYADFLYRSASVYRKTQEDIAAQVRRLVN